MKNWQVFEDKNIADVLVEVYGRSKKNLFSNIVKSFACILIADADQIKKKIEKRIAIEGDDFSQLVFNFVENLIYQKDVFSLIFKEGVFSFDKEKVKKKLRASLFGQKIDQDLQINTDIKALTMHKFKVEKKGDFYKVVMVFDL
ncbi:MAG: archease [Patescibacteria group bacterium]|nr:archease [Patescibacteria group bacterium]